MTITEILQINVRKEVRDHCTGKLSRSQQRELQQLNLGKRGMDQNVRLAKCMLDFLFNFYGGGEVKYHCIVGQASDCCFNIDNLDESCWEFMVYNHFWFYIVHPSRLFPHGCVYILLNESDVNEFVAFFETGRYFYCGRELDYIRIVKKIILVLNVLTRRRRRSAVWICT